MHWYEIVVMLAGVAGGIFTLLTMRQRKEGLVIDNLKRIIDEIRTTHEQYKTDTNEKINQLERKMDLYEQKDRIQMLCINKAFRCQLPKDNSVCPVVQEFENRSLELDKMQSDEKE